MKKAKNNVNIAVLKENLERIYRGQKPYVMTVMKSLIKSTHLTDNLYKRHPRLYAQDPFNGTIRNTGAPEYEIRWLEGYEFADLTGYHDEVKESSPLPNMKHVNQAIMIVVEDCGKEKFQKAGSKGKAYYLITIKF